ncbi:unnamed protein product (macronuclear) [Paramecium tetraurelia]|uniref:Transmembrane protein n=1 Tax=Paramecium tetraurelia TaxID=5888 RepID=A0C529_PARTE|nr:uncharacterized protein GSPATT00006395001 [Paramecium tetraurelia]CAK65896.1 unnamed protein product [Paramecium tetraurelia]|eukprot:XP_001433293.1 hypothetical protein (macronuclear) [Paramecium tetraurelia strain d4-2]
MYIINQLLHPLAAIVTQFDQKILSLKRQTNSASYILSPQIYNNFQSAMKPSSKRKIKKKITKHIIHFIIFKEEHLSSPHNTNQYLLTKHINQEICKDVDPKEPGSHNRVIHYFNSKTQKDQLKTALICQTNNPEYTQSLLFNVIIYSLYLVLYNFINDGFSINQTKQIRVFLYRPSLEYNQRPCQQCNKNFLKFQ